MSSPFPEQVTPGGVLIYPQIQSPDYVPGTSGWAIFSNGTVEFNSGTFRGTVTGGAFDGADFIINSAGSFFYSSTPAAGNLIASTAPASGVDTFGNQYIQGQVSYNPGASSVRATQVYNGQVVLWVASVSITSTSPVWWQQVGAPQAIISLESSAVGDTEPGLHLGVTNSLPVWADAQLIASSGIVAVQPGSSPPVAETWHYPTLNSPFKSQTGSQKVGYKLMPDNSVWIMGVLNLSTGTSWSGTIFTLPSGYVPASQCDGPVGAFGPTADGTPYMVAAITGAVTLGPVPAGTTAVIVDFRFPLDGTNA